MKRSLGIIGFGQFTRFFIPYLAPHFSEITVASRTDKSRIAKELKVNFSSVEDAAQKDVVILAMPISQIENVLNRIKDRIKPDTLVMDVCSIKIYPIKMMKKILPRNVRILSTHPLFGPQSGKNGIIGLEIILCPVRLPQRSFEEIRDIFTAMGLKTTVATAQEHDKVMAYSQALTHFFAQGILKTLPRTTFKFSTPSATRLLSIVNDVKDDSPILFRDMETLNPLAVKMRKDLLKNLNAIDRKLNNKI